MIRLANEYLSICILKHGAQLCSLLGSDGTEYLWQGDPHWWANHAPILFPYCGRCTDGKYTLRGRLYELPLHGFAKNSTFTVVQQSETAVTLELCETAETLAVYPFAFSFRVTYSLDERKLSVTFSVENRSESVMPFGLGVHPGFRVPLVDGLKLTDYALTFSDDRVPQQIRLSEDRFILEASDPLVLEAGTCLPLHEDLFACDTVLLYGMAPAVTLSADKDTRAITVSYPDMDYLAIWQKPYTDAPFVCIEPWCSLPARSGVVEDFDEQPSLKRLGVGEKKQYSFSISIK